MPEVVRGSRKSVDVSRSSTNLNRVRFGPESPSNELPTSPLSPTESPGPAQIGIGRKSTDNALQRRTSDRYENRPVADAYYDSRAATKREFKRRASTLQEYYKQHPTLLPQLPFTWKHGFKRWKLFALIFLIFVDACVVPIVLYYAMRFAGNVQGWIIFAVVATIWGGPTYVEFAVRSWRLIKKEDFFRPLGTKNRWAFDYVHWLSTAAIASVTAFLIIGSAPHIVWLRILSLPGPALLLVLGGGILWVTIYHVRKWPAPFRLSSTGKGEAVRPGVFYIVEDVAAVNANAGRPFREAINARFESSPMFRDMMLKLSWAWSIPSVIIAIVLIVLICVHEVSKEVAYGLGWGLPFFWALIWGIATVPYVKWAMNRETEAWENEQILDPEKKLTEIESGPPSQRDEVEAPRTLPRPVLSSESTAASAPGHVSEPVTEAALEQKESAEPVSTPGPVAPAVENEATSGETNLERKQTPTPPSPHAT